MERITIRFIDITLLLLCEVMVQLQCAQKLNMIATAEERHTHTHALTTGSYGR